MKNPISHMWKRYKAMIDLTNSNLSKKDRADVRNAYKAGAAAMFHLMDQVTHLETDDEIMAGLQSIDDEIKVIGRTLDEAYFDNLIDKPTQH